MATQGYFSLLLHAHLPFVRHPEHERFLEERWFFEAMTETYLPMLLVLEDLAREGLEFRIAWSLTPTLISMWDDDLLQERYRRHLRGLIELAARETVRQKHHPDYRETAEFYLERFRLLQNYYEQTCQCDVTGAFRRLQDQGHVEILASAATHGFLPLLRHEPSSVRAQVQVGVDMYRERFGRQPQGIWLPECGFYPGLDEVLSDAGVRYTCLESHAVLNGSTRTRHGVYAPVVCSSGVAAFGRDPECSKQVWSATEGFPGDPDYREFYWDIGYDLPVDYIAPYIGADGVRVQTGIKYHRITGETQTKQPYVRSAALKKAASHADLFLQWRKEQVAWLGERMDRKPLIMAPYDAELFGHWWFEGPEWVNFLLRAMTRESETLLAVTPSEYLAEYPESQMSTPSASSWGEGGYYDVWLNEQNDWLYPALHQAAGDMADLAFRNRGVQGRRRRLLNQAGRELLLAQASDWSFIMKTGTATGYALNRSRSHLENYFRLSEAAHTNDDAGELLARLEASNNLFPRLEFEAFVDRTPKPDFAVSRGPRHVAFLSAEMAPFVKVGGLADVVGALPEFLARCGPQVTVVLPGYRSIERSRRRLRVLATGLAVLVGTEPREFDLVEVEDMPAGVRLLLVEMDDYFGRDGVYVDPATKAEYPDTAERFSFFTRAALEGLRRLAEPVDVLHSHDHQTALASAYLKVHYRDDPCLGLASSVYTLHNLGYQGVYGPDVLDVAGFGREQFFPGSPFEHHGLVNWMKIGITFADKVSTVSRSYAREICEDAQQGAGLGDVLNERRRDLVGIVNGIDTNEWNPAADPALPAPFDAEHIEGKVEAKRELLERAGLVGSGKAGSADLQTPIVGIISRLVDQKGLDLIEDGMARLLAMGVRLVVLGTGLSKYEEFLADAAARNPGVVAALLRFDNSMAHLIEGGADIFLMPSLYEPCGLNQMYSLRYGTVPVVRETGGLSDTVSDADERDDGVGFTFEAYRVEAMLDALARALKAYRDPERWRAIQRRGMRRNFSWGVSAGRYMDLYRNAMVSSR